MNQQIKSYTNGNRSVEISKDGETFKVTSSVFNGIEWQYGHSGAKKYKTLKAATKSAEKMVTDISKGWTKYPEWTIA